MRKITLYLLSFFILAFLPFAHSEDKELTCCLELKEILSQIQRLPRANDLISKALEKGGISIEINHALSEQFEGYWSPEDRSIYVSQVQTTSPDDLLHTLLFELHNASRDADFDYFNELAYSHQISKPDYVNSIEFIEFENIRSTTDLIKEGITLGIFSSDCYKYYPEDFAEHFQNQELGGHVDWIERNFDELFGTSSKTISH